MAAARRDPRRNGLRVPAGLLRCAGKLCANADIYVPLAPFGGPAPWIVLLIALIRKRVPVILRVLTLSADIAVPIPCLWTAWVLLSGAG